MGPMIGTRHVLLASTALVAGTASATYLLDEISTSAAAAYGMRKLLSASGSCLRLRRDSDNAESDFGFVGEDLDTSAISTWLGAASGYITTLYDQSGNGHDVQIATAAYQPLYVASGQNGHPVARFDGTDDVLNNTTASVLSGGAAVTSLCVHRPDVVGLYDMFTVGNAGSLGGMWACTPEYAVRVNVGNTIFATAASTAAFELYSAQVPVNSKATDIIGWKNGAALSVSSESAWALSFGDAITIGTYYTGTDIGAQYYDGDIAEILVYASELSSADRQTIESNINTYWSIY